jgi:hypothetical protein
MHFPGTNSRLKISMGLLAVVNMIVKEAEVWSPCSCGKWRLSWKMCGRLRSIKTRVFHFRHFQ